MAITILIPTVLRAFTDRKSEVLVEGKTPIDAIANFATIYPDIHTHLYDESSELRSYINVYLNGKNIKKEGGLDVPVTDGDTIILVPAIAGGRGGY